VASERAIVDSSSFDILQTDAAIAARRLLGCVLEREIDGHTVRVKIVETEAYDQTDAASHSFNGQTPRVETMFGSAGYLYVYFTYGMHYCCNIVVGEKGYGAAVLIRAVEPLSGHQALEKRRAGKLGIEMTNGPAKLCQALNIDSKLNGHNLHLSPLRLHIYPPVSSLMVTATTRVGISKAKDALWRFYLTDSPYVSVKEHLVK
jgi:DNA-3-methyladenine glycosylase